MYFLFPFDQIQRNSKIVIFGTGKMGSDFYYQIMMTKYCEIAGWTDSNTLKDKDMEYPYCNASQLMSIKYDFLVIAINNAWIVQKEVIPMLLEIGVKPETIIWRFDQSLDESKKERFFEKWNLSDKKAKKSFEICRANECIGCGVCREACPHNAIKLVRDSCGFIYPHVTEKCINCGKCKMVCPSQNKQELRAGSEYLYAYSLEEKVRFNASSGGIVPVLALHFLRNGGVVFGAAFDDEWNLKHIAVESAEQLSAIGKSKYVQSEMADTYNWLDKYVQEKREILFIGTPCQISGVKSRYSDTSLQNVIFIDLFCHGVMSCEMFRYFLKEFVDLKDVKEVIWRDKSFGWEKSVDTMKILLKDGSHKYICGEENLFMRSFLSNLALRESCYHCQYQRMERIGDLTVGDAWGTNWQNEKGVNIISVNTEKGKEILKNVSKEIQYLKAAKYAIGGNAIRQFNFSSQTNRFKDLISRRELPFSEICERTMHEKYDIAIVGGYHWSNYGDEITYYALYKVLKNWGYDVMMVNWPRSANWWTKKRPLLFRVNPYKDYELNDVYENYNQIQDLNNKVSCFISGSGIYMMPEIAKQTGYLQLLEWVKEDCKKIAYSIAFGTEKLNITEDEIDRYKKALGKFDGIGIRETSGLDILENTLDIKDSQWVLDPVFLMDLNDYCRLIEGYNQKEDYLFTYVIDNMNEETYRFIDFICKEYGIQNHLISRYEKADEYLDRTDLIYKAPLEEWLSSFYYSRYILTDSFHGICLCIKFHKEFSVFIGGKERFSTRIIGLLQHLGLTDRIVNSTQDIHRNLSSPIDYDQVDRILDVDIKTSVDWLRGKLSIRKSGDQI